MAGLFRAIKRVMSGEVIRRIDTKIMGGACTVSLRLKQDKGSTNRYVVMAGLARGNYQYYAFEPAEFEQFAQAIQELRALLHA